MTTPLQTRRALSEIPEILEQLRVGATPTTDDLADEPTATANVLNPTVIGNLNNSFNGRSTVQSPDEIVIRQRGRRRISLTWSPDKYGTLGSRYTQKTPTKGSNLPLSTTSMVLRSSPRKRLMLSESFSLNSPQKRSNSSNGTSPWKNESFSSIVSSSSNGDDQQFTPVMKRMKFENDNSSIGQTNVDTPLPVMLKGLSQNQLIDIIKDLIQIEPHLEEKIRDDLPFPDLSCFEDQLIQMKKNIFKSIPSSRLSQKTDSTAYSRATIYLSEFKKCVVSHCHTLNESKHWDALIDYINIAWHYVRATPIWDNHSHNAVRRQCFKLLTCHFSAALRHGGIRLGQERLSLLTKNITDMSKDYDEIKSSLTVINQFLSRLSSND